MSNSLALNFTALPPIVFLRLQIFGVTLHPPPQNPHILTYIYTLVPSLIP
jgi:hypothetical protein